MLQVLFLFNETMKGGDILVSWNDAIWLMIAAFLLGVIVRDFIGRIQKSSSHASGSIVINTLEPDADRYSIIIRDPIDDLPKKEYVILKVEVMKAQ